MSEQGSGVTGVDDAEGDDPPIEIDGDSSERPTRRVPRMLLEDALAYVPPSGKVPEVS